MPVAIARAASAPHQQLWPVQPWAGAAREATRPTPRSPPYPPNTTPGADPAGPTVRRRGCRRRSQRHQRCVRAHSPLRRGWAGSTTAPLVPRQASRAPRPSPSAIGQRCSPVARGPRAAGHRRENRTTLPAAPARRSSGPDPGASRWRNGRWCQPGPLGPAHCPPGRARNPLGGTPWA